jgi:hypothetical protein
VPARVAAFTGSPPASQQVSFVEPDVFAAVVVPQLVLGFAATERSGTTTASFRLHDGSSSSALVLVPLVTLAAGESLREWISSGLEVNYGGVWLEVVSGAIEGCVYW